MKSLDSHSRPLVKRGSVSTSTWLPGSRITWYSALLGSVRFGTTVRMTLPPLGAVTAEVAALTVLPVGAATVEVTVWMAPAAGTATEALPGWTVPPPMVR